jgi:hypothetical protein
MMHSKSFARRLFAGAAACCLVLPFTLQPATADGPPAPPPEAYAACESKAAGDACVVDIHGTEVKGVCAADPAGRAKLACRPSSPPPCPPPSHGMGG